MPDRQKVDVVCFDLGGVIVRICRSWREACIAAGLQVRERASMADSESARSALLHQYSVGALSEAEWAEQSAAATNGEYSAVEHLRIHDAVTLDEYPGVGAIVEELRAAGVRTACLSNTTHTHWVRLLHHDGKNALPGVPRYPTVRQLDAHFASHLLRLAKPDPAIYRAFEQGVGAVGARILFFDDLPENVAAARTVGWQAERIDHTVETAPQIRKHLREHRVL